MKEQMNERLKALMIEAGYAAPELAGRGQKLAVLIAEECAQICIDRWVDRVSDDARECYLEIQKRFGLDES